MLKLPTVVTSVPVPRPSLPIWYELVEPTDSPMSTPRLPGSLMSSVPLSIPPVPFATMVPAIAKGTSSELELMSQPDIEITYVPLKLPSPKPPWLGVTMLLLEPHAVIKEMLAIAKATSRPPAHLLLARDFIRHSCLLLRWMR